MTVLVRVLRHRWFVIPALAMVAMILTRPHHHHPQPPTPLPPAQHLAALQPALGVPQVPIMTYGRRHGRATECMVTLAPNGRNVVPFYVVGGKRLFLHEGRSVRTCFYVNPTSPDSPIWTRRA